MVLGLEGCGSMSTTQKGTAIGAGGGAALGAAIGAIIGKGKGAAIGAAVGTIAGGTAGTLIGKKMQKQAEEIARAALEKVGLVEKAASYPNALSGGQQQRVAIARALATKPEIIYFDEPTSALDPELTGEVLSVMRRLAEEGMTMLVVTHELGFARNVSTKTMFMDKGTVVESGPSAELFANPKEERTRAFLNTITQHEKE